MAATVLSFRREKKVGKEKACNGGDVAAATRGSGASPSGLPHSHSAAGRTGEGACFATPNTVFRRTNAVSRCTNKPPAYKSYRSYESYFLGDTRVLSHARQAHNQEPPFAPQTPSLSSPNNGIFKKFTI